MTYPSMLTSPVILARGAGRLVMGLLVDDWWMVGRFRPDRFGRIGGPERVACGSLRTPAAMIWFF